MNLIGAGLLPLNSLLPTSYTPRKVALSHQQ